MSQSLLAVALFALTQSVYAVQPLSYSHKLTSLVTSVNSNPTSTFQAGLNERWLGHDIEFVKKQMGTRLTGGPKLPKLLHNTLGKDLPEEFDARKQWPECPTISDIRDQSHCGSCWAFGAIESASDRVCIATSGKLKPHLSAEDILSCCGYSCGDGCNGGWPAAAMEYLTSTGAVTGGNYNDFSLCSAYEFEVCEHHSTGSHPSCSGSSETPECPTACDKQSTYTVPFEQDKHKFDTAYSIDSREEQIMVELMTNGPVETAFSVYEDFLTYKKGVYQHVEGDELGGHAVRMLGWGVEKTDSGEEVKYWLLANSWNEDWGDNGYFKILRGEDHMGIESGVVAVKYGNTS